MKQRKKVFKKETKGLGHPPAASDLFLENKVMLGEGIKGNIYRRPISSVYQKTKIYPSIYKYHHIDTQLTESHFADCTLPATWTTAQPCLPSLQRIPILHTILPTHILPNCVNFSQLACTGTT